MHTEKNNFGMFEVKFNLSVPEVPELNYVLGVISMEQVQFIII